VFLALDDADGGLSRRFLTKDLADKYGIDVPPYQGMDQIVEVTAQEEKL
jgi:NAD(P)H-hydrate epimerase